MCVIPEVAYVLWSRDSVMREGTSIQGHMGILSP